MLPINYQDEVWTSDGQRLSRMLIDLETHQTE